MDYRSITVSAHGGPEKLRPVSVTAADPGPGIVRVRVLAAGVSYGDVLLRAGVIPGGPRTPFVPGFDVTGVVDAVGAGVDSPRPGQLVTALLKSGGYSEYTLVPAERLVPVPEGVDPVRAAATALNYFVAYQMLHRVAQVRPGEHILVHGAAGGVGVALMQLGARVPVELHGTCSAGKLGIVADLGGHAIDYRSGDFRRALGDVSGDISAVFDPVGGGHFRRSYQVLRPGGVMVGFGQSDAYRDGRPRMLTGAWGMLGGIVLPKLQPDGRRAVFYNAWSLEKKLPDAYRQDLAAVLDLLAKGVIGPLGVKEIPLADAAQAQQLIEHDSPLGKVVLTA
jgi:NADPH:quinone reductase-like Zn-dependent oxidoreductase